MKVLLFDIDGVLLEAGGYHRALQETVRRAALAMGFGELTLTPDDIAAFEAGGITSEWDEAAISTALLLDTVWADEPECGLPVSLAQPVRTPARTRPAPDFQAVARRLAGPDLSALPPLERAERLFLDSSSHTPAQAELLRLLLRSARQPERSLTHRTFQELVLGSAEFARSYHLPAVLNAKSYLLKYDRSNLSTADSARLRVWLAAPGHAAAILTSRPSRPPAGVFSTPEAEQGAALVGLAGLPILGWGGLCWLGRQRQADPQTFLKPSPVHALAALRMAHGASLQKALSESADYVEHGQVNPAWEQLHGNLVSVFEDTPGGINSLRTAQSLLVGAGIHLETEFYGIAHTAVKVLALQGNGATVFPSLVEALNATLYQ